jgi:cell division protein FtsB
MSIPVSQVRGRVPRLAEAAVERARLTVVPRRVQRAPRVPFVTLVSLLLVGGVAGLLLFNTHMQQASFVAGSLEQQARALSAQEESLRMQLHRLRDPQNVAARAKRLGMVPAESPAFLRLSDGAILGNPSPATAEAAVRIDPLAPVKPKLIDPDPVIVELPPPRRADRSGGRAGRDTTRTDSSTSRRERRGSRTTGGIEPPGSRQSAGRTP